MFVALAGIAGPQVSPEAVVPGAWLESYDPDAHDGRGSATWTTDPGRAMRFASPAAALAAWRTQSVIRPLRDDGRPNRPLTAATVSVERLP